MSLVKTFEKQGNFLFKYRGQFPVILFLLAIPFVWKTDYSSISNYNEKLYTIISIMLALVGFIIRFLALLHYKLDTSNNSAHKNSITAAKNTGESEEILENHFPSLIYRPILPTGNTSPALLDYVVLFF